MRIFLVAVIFLSGCCRNVDPDLIRERIAEVKKAEEDFSRITGEKGIKEAFLLFAADDVVLNRSDSLIKGKKALEEYYSSEQYENITLSWSPDFIDVSNSGDMAYTYGHYSYSVTDSLGNVNTLQGIFHTVWKKQEDGSWKYVWD